MVRTRQSKKATDNEEGGGEVVAGDQIVDTVEMKIGIEEESGGCEGEKLEGSEVEIDKSGSGDMEQDKDVEEVVGAVVEQVVEEVENSKKEEGDDKTDENGEDVKINGGGGNEVEIKDVGIVVLEEEDNEEKMDVAESKPGDNDVIVVPPSKTEALNGGGEAGTSATGDGESSMAGADIDANQVKDDQKEPDEEVVLLANPLFGKKGPIPLLDIQDSDEEIEEVGEVVNGKMDSETKDKTEESIGGSKNDKSLANEIQRLRKALFEMSKRNALLEDFIHVEHGDKFKSFMKNRDRLIGMGYGEAASDLVMGKRTKKSAELVELLTVIKGKSQPTKPSSPPKPNAAGTGAPICKIASTYGYALKSGNEVSSSKSQSQTTAVATTSKAGTSTSTQLTPALKRASTSTVTAPSSDKKAKIETLTIPDSDEESSGDNDDYESIPEMVPNPNSEHLKMRMCPLCVDIVSAKSLKEHLLVVHHYNRVKCPIDQEEFFRRKRLRVHMKGKHNWSDEEYDRALGNTFRREEAELSGWLNQLFGKAKIPSAEVFNLCFNRSPKKTSLISNSQ